MKSLDQPGQAGVSIRYLASGYLASGYLASRIFRRRKVGRWRWWVEGRFERRHL